MILSNQLTNTRLTSPAILFTLFCLLTFASCKTVDIRSEYALTSQKTTDFEKGKQLLDKAYFAMGYDKLEDISTYEATSLFKWKFPWSVMPMNSLPGSRNNDIQFRFTTNTFDGQVTFLEGRKKGKTYGLQSWQGYRFKEGKELKVKDNNRYNWGLPTYHYVIEAPMRLRHAEIIRYAGERSFNGQDYDLVYATWGLDAPHKEHDQWMVYINKATGMIDLTQLTINDFFLPIPNGMKGATIHVDRKLAANGTYLPELVTIQLGKPKKKKKYVYRFQLNDYQFDSFGEGVLYPLPNVGKIGDTKPAKK